MCRSPTLPGRQLSHTGLLWMLRQFNSTDIGYSVLVGFAARAFSSAGLIPYNKQSLRICWSWKHVSYSYADDLTGAWCLQQVHAKWQPRSLLSCSFYLWQPECQAQMCISPQKIDAVPGLFILYSGVNSNFWLSRSLFSLSQSCNWNAWRIFPCLIYSKDVFCYLSVKVLRWLAA